MIMRLSLIAGNWKMNTTLKEAVKLVTTMLTELNQIAGAEIVLCPPFVSLASVKELLQSSSVKLGAQNMYFEERGAFTGEISPVMLAELCEFVILGHSERRQYFYETDALINHKVKAAFQFGLIPILCVGERLEENEAGMTEAIVTHQVKAALRDVNPSGQLVVAYEPVWAIGTGKAATARQAGTTISLIRNIIAGLWGREIAQKVRILYGGSVTQANITEFVAEAEIDGALVGGASLKADEFLGIVKQTALIKARA